MTIFGRSGGRLTTIKVIGGSILVDFGDTRETIVFFEDKESKLKDLREPLSRYGDYLVEDHIVKQFRRQGFPKKWAPLSEKYAAWKKRNFPGRRLLVLTGRMRRGFRSKAGPRSLRIINRITAGQGGNTTPRWFWHQFGTSRMPRRPLLQITDNDLAKLTEFVFDYLED